jgi:hypothetical protein
MQIGTQICAEVSNYVATPDTYSCERCFHPEDGGCTFEMLYLPTGLHGFTTQKAIRTYITAEYNILLRYSASFKITYERQLV